MKEFKNFFYNFLWNEKEKLIELIYWSESLGGYQKKVVYQCAPFPKKAKHRDYTAEDTAGKILLEVGNMLFSSEVSSHLDWEELQAAENQLFFKPFFGHWEISPKIVMYLKTHHSKQAAFITEAMWQTYCSITQYSWDKKDFKFNTRPNGCFEMVLHGFTCEKFPEEEEEFDKAVPERWVRLAEHNTDGSTANELAFLAGIAALTTLTLKTQTEELYKEIANI